jgi:hypothetical protein
MRKGASIIAVLFVLALLSGSALAADCVDVDLGAQIVGGTTLSVYFYALNCGTEPGLVTFSISFEKDSTPLGQGQLAVYMPADKPFVKDCDLPIPPVVPAGTYTLCITATMGQASDTACATVTIDAAGNVIGFENLKGPSPTEKASWGEIKSVYE